MRLWITGYRSYELGIFNDNDPKVAVIKYCLENNLNSYWKKDSSGSSRADSWELSSGHWKLPKRLQ